MIRTLLGVVVALGVAGSAAAEVKIRNITACYGFNGPVRDSLEMYPGDEIVFRYVIDGVKTTADGKVDGMLQLKVVNESGKVLSDKSTPLNSLLEFGGTSVPGFANLSFEASTRPGKYTLITTFTDNIQNQSTSFERVVVCKKPEFAIIRPRFSYDEKGESSASLNVRLGQRIFYSLVVRGFDVSQQKVDLVMSEQFLGDKGAELLPNALTLPLVNNNPEQVKKAEFVTFRNTFSCNRAGSFQLRITVRDNVTKQTATFEAPVVVTE